MPLDSARPYVHFSFSMSQEPPDSDGQLYTLGLLEQLRKECSQHWDASSTLYRRIDGLLRELANPNLHDIANLSHHVELWDRNGQHIRWLVAAAGTVVIGHAALDAAIESWPNERFTLRQGIRVIREHVPKGP
jgi:hypothetical protein